MLNVVTALIISTSAVLGVFGVCMFARRLGRKGACGRMVASSCPSCGRVYGSDILQTMKEMSYRWNPEPGYSVLFLRLPSSTYLVTCPRCSAEAEFTASGRVFEWPKRGVRSFTRFVRA
jgi:hypothetical protein